MRTIKLGGGGVLLLNMQVFELLSLQGRMSAAPMFTLTLNSALARLSAFICTLTGPSQLAKGLVQKPDETH